MNKKERKAWIKSQPGRCMTEEEFSEVQGMTASELRSKSKLKEFYASVDKKNSEFKTRCTTLESFKSFNEGKGGADAGKLELTKTSLKDARKYALSLMPDLDDLIPNFDKNYTFAQSLAKKGHTKRKNMPVITSSDVKKFQKRLVKGRLDIVAPFSDRTNPNDPFPEGLKNSDAEKFVENGRKQYDGSKSDDQVSIDLVMISAKDLEPIQEQIYLDKAFGTIVKFGIEKTKEVMEKKILIASADNKIIDGHHRFLSALLIDKNLKLKVLQIGLPIDKLLPLATAYGDAIGNKRNN